MSDPILDQKRAHLDTLIQDYQAAYVQLGQTLSELDRTRLKRTIAALETEIRQLQAELGIQPTSSSTVPAPIAGDNITIGNVGPGTAIAAGRGATATSTVSGDQYNMSGNFQGATVNIHSTIQGKPKRPKSDQQEGKP